jgi:hypothetical protein
MPLRGKGYRLVKEVAELDQGRQLRLVVLRVVACLRGH